MDRRNFVKLLTAGGAGQIVAATAATSAQAAAGPINVVVVGGGMAGASIAKFLCYWGKKLSIPVQVTLIEQNAAYVSCIMSNMVLTGERTLNSLTYTYDKLKANYGVKVVKAQVGRIDPVARKVYDAANNLLNATPYTRLILAPGIQFDYSTISIVNKSADKTTPLDMQVPHAWKAGPQTTQLQNQLKNLVNGARVIIAIPPAPYRCPPGPYERACVIADWMKAKKPNSKVIILDANPKIMAEPINFGNAFNGLHKNYIEYHPNAKLKSVTINSARNKQVVVSELIDPVKNVWADRTYTAEVVNLLPPMKAGQIALDTLGPAGLSADGRWALINELTYQSKAWPNIHVIGDSIASKQPKAGHIGNQEAKVCADAILRLETGLQPYPTPVTNSACFTPITTAIGPNGPTATWLTALFRYDPTIDPLTNAPKGMVIISGNPVGTPSEPLTGPSGDNYESMNKWFAALMQDTFS